MDPYADPFRIVNALDRERDWNAVSRLKPDWLKPDWLAVSRLKPIGTVELRSDKPTVSTLVSQCGSLRRLLEAYWLRRLSVEEERVIEDNVRPETLIGYKPCIR